MDPREQIKAKVDIVQFIGEHIPLKQAGRNFKALCPFHGEKTPSFVVSPERQIWHCFGCNLGGDIFTFLMEFEKLDFIEALRELAKRAGVKLTTLAPGKGEQQKEKLLQINHLASEFYHYLLTSHRIGERALEYLRKRGINKRTIKTFTLGFAPNRWDLLLGFLTKKKGYDLKEVEDAGLIIRNPKYYDRFRNRVMFTLRDHRGNVVGFAGRVLDPNAKEAHSTGSVQAKYVNTPETPLYHKGELFYGLDVAKEAIKKENQAIIVEGEFDMLSSFQEGITNVVALKGTALTEMQAKLIRRFTQNIALAFDVDVAGDAAARRGIEIADNEGLNIKVIQVKDAKDPDEAIRKNPLIWKKAIKKAVSVYDFLIDSALARFDPASSDGKKAISDEVLPSLSAITNEIVKAHFVKMLSSKLDVSEEIILRQMGKLQKPRTVLASQGSAKLEQRNRQEVLEEYLMALLLQRGEGAFVKSIAENLDFLQSPPLKKIFEYLVAFYEKESSFAILDFTKDLPKELLPTVDRLYLFDTELIRAEHVSLELERAIRELRVMLLRKKMVRIVEDLKEGEKASDAKGVTMLKEEFNLISSQLHELTKEQHIASN